MGVEMTAVARSGRDVPDDVVAHVRAQQRRKWLIRSLRLGIAVALLALWELLAGEPGSRFTLVDSYYVSEPSLMFETVRDWVEDGVLWPNLLATIRITLIGFFIGAVAGLVVGVLLGLSSFWSSVLNPFVTALYSIPRLALIPLFLLWFGLGTTSKLALVVVVVFFLVFYNTFAGVRDVDRDLVDVMRVMGARRRHVLFKVTLPSAMVWIVAGLRVSVPYALVGSVTAEMLMSNEGMGYLIMRSSGQFNTAGVYGGIVILMLLALVLNGLVGVLEKSLLKWKAQTQERGGHL